MTFTTRSEMIYTTQKNPIKNKIIPLANLSFISYIPIIGGNMKKLIIILLIIALVLVFILPWWGAEEENISPNSSQNTVLSHFFDRTFILVQIVAE